MRAVVALLAGLGAFAGVGLKATELSDDRILFGQSAAFSGPAQELGKNMRLGIQAAFAEANKRGGIHGRKLELLSLDDAYEPEAAIVNTRQLIENSGVFALIGAVGTPTSRSAAPVAAANGVPYIAPFTGAAFLRDPTWRNVINLRASYDQETEAMVARLTADLGIERIAVLYQDDSFGRAGYRGALHALERRGMAPAAIGVYPRNTTAIKTALLDLWTADPGAVILVGAYQPVATLIAWARHMGWDPVFITISFVGSNALARELGPAGTGVFVTQVVPFPTDDSFPVVGDYRRAAEVHFEAGYVPRTKSVEAFAQACRSIGEPILGKPVNEISVARLLAQLFRITETFAMPTQPQLLLLQKTMMMVEGACRRLAPEANLWELSKPFLDEWVHDNLSAETRVRDTLEEAAATVRKIPDMLEKAQIAADVLSPEGVRLHPDSERAIGSKFVGRRNFIQFVLIFALVVFTLAILFKL